MCFVKNMIKIILLISSVFLLSACVNKHGISAKYYSDCTEYFDFQGYYHKKCGEDDIITYKKMGKTVKKIGKLFTSDKPKPNVY